MHCESTPLPEVAAAVAATVVVVVAVVALNRHIILPTNHTKTILPSMTYLIRVVWVDYQSAFER